MRCKARYIRRAAFGIAQRKAVDHHHGVCGAESAGAYSRRRAISSQTAHPHGGQGTKHIGRRTTRQTLQCFARLREAQCRCFRTGFLTPSVYAYEREGAEAVDFERRIAGARRNCCRNIRHHFRSLCRCQANGDEGGRKRTKVSRE